MRDYKIDVDCLILEITRRCNMSCLHCCRGPAQKINITPEIISKTFEKVNYIGNVTFTGGEPTLNVKAIEYVADYANYSPAGLNYNSFWLAVNGSRYSVPMINALNRLYWKAGDQDICGLTLSLDQYHSDIPERNIEKYMALPYFENSRKCTRNSENTILEGNALKYNLPGREPKEDKEFRVEIDNEKGYLYVDILYINAKGDILSDCDYSYENQEKYKLGNILTDDLASIILNHRKNETCKAV